MQRLSQTTVRPRNKHVGQKSNAGVKTSPRGLQEHYQEPPQGRNYNQHSQQRRPISNANRIAENPQPRANVAEDWAATSKLNLHTAVILQLYSGYIRCCGARTASGFYRWGSCTKDANKRRQHKFQEMWRQWRRMGRNPMLMLSDNEMALHTRRMLGALRLSLALHKWRGLCAGKADISAPKAEA